MFAFAAKNSQVLSLEFFSKYFESSYLLLFKKLYRFIDGSNNLVSSTGTFLGWQKIKCILQIIVTEGTWFLGVYPSWKSEIQIESLSILRDNFLFRGKCSWPRRQIYHILYFLLFAILVNKFWHSAAKTCSRFDRAVFEQHRLLYCI